MQINSGLCFQRSKSSTLGWKWVDWLTWAGERSASEVMGLHYNVLRFASSSLLGSHSFFPVCVQVGAYIQNVFTWLYGWKTMMLLQSQHYAISPNLPLTLFYSWGNCSTEGLSNLPKILLLVIGIESRCYSRGQPFTHDSRVPLWVNANLFLFLEKQLNVYVGLHWY